MLKKLVSVGFFGLIAVVTVSAFAAEPVQRRGAVATSTGVSSRGQAVPPAGTPVTVSGRAASSSAPGATGIVSARSGTVTRARTTASPAVTARAGAMQKVVQTGTGIAAAAANTIVDAACRERYFGCMDSFCMLENDNGGRCMCSDKKADYDDILAQIETLDLQSYKLATEGVEMVDLGSKADYVFDIASQIEKSTASEAAVEKRKQDRLNVDLGIMGQVDFALDTNIFSEEAAYDLGNKSGEALRSSVNSICLAQMSGCERDLPMLQALYAQNIASDCRAYENELNKRKDASAQKLSAAQTAVRAAALESFETANKWDLGQCALQMKKCVQDNGCGEDFTGCVGVAAMANASGARSASQRMTRIQGPNTYIELTASSVDALEAKRTICFETVTSSCIAVRDQVWGAFMQDVAPAIKTAELTAESDIRMGCIGNISACFQKACLDTMDPNNPDGSYDLCLSRPQAIEHLCKVQIDQCSVTDARDIIMNFVYARLAAMRVDACTAQAKACFEADTACGKDFQNCIGLGLDDVKKMCPIEKLTACNYDSKTGTDLIGIDQLDRLLLGIYLSVDNSALTQCQKIVDEKMIEICGDTASCEAFDDDASLGTESLAGYKNSNGDYVIEGLMSYAGVGTTAQNTVDAASYLGTIAGADARVKNRINNALASVSNKVATKIGIMANDTQVQFCVNGRSMRNISGENRTSEARFPNLLDTYKKTIIDAGLTRAQVNYSKKYNELYAEAFKGQSAEINRAACMAMAGNMTQPICTAWNTDQTTGEAICSAHAPGATTLFDDAGTQGVDSLATSITIPGLKISEINRLNATGRSDYVQTDAAGTMIAAIRSEAIYSETSNTCVMNVTTTSCKGIESVYDTTSAESKNTNLGGSFMGLFGPRVGHSTNTVKTSTFRGTVCTEYDEPVTVETVIQM